MHPGICDSAKRVVRPMRGFHQLVVSLAGGWRMCRSLYRGSIIFFVALSGALFATGAVAQLQTADSQVQMVTQLVDQIAFGNQLLNLTDPASSQEELPGLGHKFELFGAMIRDTDPENSVGNSGASGGGVGGNEAISATVAPGTVATAFRNTPPGIKIRAFTNQLGLKYHFVAPKTCAAGSPRITLLVDANGDGKFVSVTEDPTSPDFAAHGHVNPPAYAGCVTNKWKYEDLADDLPRWEVTPGGAVPGVPVFPFTPWKIFADLVTAAFPNHKVLAGFLLDGESCSFGVAANCGKAYYDLVTIENRTLEIWQDTVKK